MKLEIGNWKTEDAEVNFCPLRRALFSDLPSILRVPRSAFRVAAAALILLPAAALAVEPDVPETWRDGDAAEWVAYDPLNARGKSLENPANYLQVAFRSQSRPYPEVRIVRAVPESSFGRFTGDYRVQAITNVSFRFYCETHKPADLRLYLCNEATGNWWQRILTIPPAGEWATFNVSLDYSDGWQLGTGGTEPAFYSDIENITWAGIQIQRNKTTEAHGFRIDDFVVQGASETKDSDGDTVSDRAEWIAGTDRLNRNSAFRLRVMSASRAKEVIGETNGVLLQWESAPGRKYSVLRSTNLSLGFTPLAVDLPATPPLNTYIDETAVGSGPYFYKTEVR